MAVKFVKLSGLFERLKTNPKELRFQGRAAWFACVVACCIVVIAVRKCFGL